MVKLNGEACAVGVYPPGQFFKTGKKPVVVQPGLAGAGVAARVDRHDFGGDKGKTAESTPFIVGDETLGKGSVRMGIVCSHGGDDKAVAKRHRVDGYRLE